MAPMARFLTSLFVLIGMTLTSLSPECGHCFLENDQQSINLSAEMTMDCHGDKGGESQLSELPNKENSDPRFCYCSCHSPYQVVKSASTVEIQFNGSMSSSRPLLLLPGWTQALYRPPIVG